MVTKRTLQRQLQKVYMKKSQEKVDMDNILNKDQLWNQIYDEPKQIEQLAVSDADIVEYIRITLRHMVDDVILYNERLKTEQANIFLASVPQAREAEKIQDIKTIQK